LLVARKDLIQGDLQEQIMRVMWRLDRGSVDDVRKALPKPGAYTTAQTVLNRLAERGLLERERVGKVIHYSTRLTEADYLARSLNQTLAGASEEARRTALAGLVGELNPSELSDIRALAGKAERKRRR
jgi:predicted transcriptional regulator